MFRDKDLARIGYEKNELYVEFPRIEPDFCEFPGDLESAESLLRKFLTKELASDDLSDDLDELQYEMNKIQLKINRYISYIAGFKEDIQAIEEKIKRSIVGEAEAEWLDLLIRDMISKMSPDYVHPYNTKLGYKPTEIAIAEWYDRDESGVKGDSILDFGISVHWGKKPAE